MFVYRALKGSYYPGGGGGDLCVCIWGTERQLLPLCIFGVLRGSYYHRRVPVCIWGTER